MATGIIEVFAKGGYDVTFVARTEEKARRYRGADPLAGEGGVAGRLTEADPDAVLGRLTGNALAGRPG